MVIVFDPKGDADLLKRMYVECERAGRLDEFYVFHLGHPDLSARYNAVGRFGRISEVATRVAGQPGEGNSAAFREFAWRFVNIIARALHALGIRPDYQQILRHVVNIDALFVEYAQKYISEHDPRAWDTIIQIEGKLNDKNIPFNMKGRPLRVVAIDQYLTQKRIADPVMEGLKSAVRYDKTYFDKIVASLLPLLEKLTTGRISGCFRPTTRTSTIRGRSSTGCRSSANAPWSTSASTHYRIPRSPPRWATPCSATWSRWRVTSTSMVSMTACPARSLAARSASTCMPTSSTS